MTQIENESKNATEKIKVTYNHLTGVIIWSGLDFEVNVLELLMIEQESWDYRSELDRQTSCHGIKQKVNDARAAITPAKGYTKADMVEAMQEVVDHLANNQWSKTKESGKGKTVTLPNFIKGSVISETPADNIIQMAKVFFPLIPEEEVTRLIGVYTRELENESE